MHTAEEKLKKRMRNSKIQRAVLTSLYTVGVISIALAMPNVLSVLRHIDPNKKDSENRRYAVNNAIKRLRDKGLVAWKETEKGVFLRLTEGGERTLRLIERNEFKSIKPRKWDGKWRIIIFDIREKRKGTREKFRKKLQQIGFLKLQNSVWVFPYNCEEIITLIKADYKIGKEILYIIADSIENDKWVRKYFELK